MSRLLRWTASTRSVVLLAAAALAVDTQKAGGAFPDERDAHALYDRMVQTMRDANSLSWVSDYRWESRGKTLGRVTYRIWLQKPNFARVEATRAGENSPSGILIGDGETFWIHWPNGKPRYPWEEKGKYAEDWEQNRWRFYIKKASPPGAHSIGHEVGSLGAGMSMTIVDPSTFHGYTDSLQPYLDGVRKVREEIENGELLDVIEVSFMDHQRSWLLWLARKDHLPRKLEETVRVSNEIKIYETWSEIQHDAGVPQERFQWKPPAGWKEWKEPPIEEGLLAAGTEAPDFELQDVAGGKFRLSELRGKTVWFFKWRVG